MRVAFVSLVAILGSSAARPNSKNEPSTILPHGMIPSALSGNSERIHNAVLGDSAEGGLTCKNRLIYIRELMAAGKFKEAVDVSLALEAHHRASKKHADCHADQPHVGEGSIITQVSTPGDRGPYSSKPVIDSFIKLHRQLDTEEGAGVVGHFLRIAHTSRASVRKSMARVPVVGFTLDSTFVLAEAPLRCTFKASGDPNSSTLSCSGGGDLHEHLVSDEKEATALLLLLSELTAAGKRRRRGNEKKESESRRLMAEWTNMGQPLIPSASRVAAEIAARESRDAKSGGPTTRAASLGDESSSYAVGSKKTLVLPMVPTDGVTTDDQAGYNYPLGYDYGLVKTNHGSNIRSYLQECMTQNSDFYKHNSWGAMDLDITITPVLQVSYTGATCGDPKALTYQNTPDPTALDVMSYAAASSVGFDHTAYDFNVLFMPKCYGQPFAGVGWVGVPGCLQNTRLSDYDAAVAHELGHNLGAMHASYMTAGSRGADAFGTLSDLNDRSDWTEYGNPHSTMGRGNFVNGAGKADFVIEGKAVFDWVSDAELIDVIPYGAVGECQACGSYYLSPTDATTKPASGATLGISIATATVNRYYFIEHRTASTSGNAALITWADINLYGGETGIYGNSVLVDCTPSSTDWLDAGCAPGMSIQLSTGSGADDAQEITVSVLQVESDGTLAVQVALSAPTTAPTISHAPTRTVSPTPLPTTQYPCQTVTLAGPYTGMNSDFLGDYTIAGEDTNGNVYFTGPIGAYMYFNPSGYWAITTSLGASSVNWYVWTGPTEWPESTGWNVWTGAGGWVTPAGVTLACAASSTSTPVPEPTRKPTPEPTPLHTQTPSIAPTTVDTAAVSVEFTLASSLTPDNNRQAQLKATVEEQVAADLGVSSVTVDDFAVTSVQTSARRRRRLGSGSGKAANRKLAAYEWTTSFTLKADLAAAGLAGHAALVTSVSTSLTSAAFVSQVSSRAKAEVDTASVANGVAALSRSVNPTAFPTAGPCAPVTFVGTSKGFYDGNDASLTGPLGEFDDSWMGAGLNVMSFSSTTNELLSQQNFDTYSSASEVSSMLSFLQAVPSDSLVVVLAMGFIDQHSGAKNIGDDLKNYMSTAFGASQFLSLTFSESYGLIGFKGGSSPLAEDVKGSGSGFVTVTAAIPCAVTPISSPTQQPIPSPTSVPTKQPLVEPTMPPVFDPIPSPTWQPISSPTYVLTKQPMVEPTMPPVFDPIPSPTRQPIPSPISVPTKQPLVEPTMPPVFDPIPSPTQQPIPSPTSVPTKQPLVEPTMPPVLDPILSPTLQPILAPTLVCAPVIFVGTSKGFSDGNDASLTGPLDGFDDSWMSRGFNIMTFSSTTRELLAQQNFDTYKSDLEVSSMLSFLQAVPSGSLVVVLAMDAIDHWSGAKNIGDDLKNYMSTAFGASQFSSLTFRESYGLIGFKGESSPLAEDLKGSGSGFVTVTAAVPCAATPISSPTWQPIPSPTSVSTKQPLVEPTMPPVFDPIPSPTWQPIPSPTYVPTKQPLVEPTRPPVFDPIPSPTWQPIPSPISVPTKQPMVEPTMPPVFDPIPPPTRQPILSPTYVLTKQPLVEPTMPPVFDPIPSPTRQPIPSPTSVQTKQPMVEPTMPPVFDPIPSPTLQPILAPTLVCAPVIFVGTSKGFSDGNDASLTGPLGGFDDSWMGRGFNIMSFSSTTRELLAQQNFDTYKSDLEVSSMLSFLQAVPSGSLVVVLAMDAIDHWSGAKNIGDDLKNYMSTAFGASQFSSLTFRESYGLIGFKGESSPLAEDLKGSGSGFVTVTAAVPCAVNKQPIPSPTSVPTKQPLVEPTMPPVFNPTPFPVAAPVPTPTSVPTKQPLVGPTMPPVFNPTPFPVAAPVPVPTSVPTKQPLVGPTMPPVFNPTLFPVAAPVPAPTSACAPITFVGTSKGFSDGNDASLTGPLGGFDDSWMSRGFNVVSFAATTNYLLSQQTFDTYDSEAESDAMFSFLLTVPSGSLVVVLAMDAIDHWSGNKHIGNNLKSYISTSFGASQFSSLTFRESYGFIGYKGDSTPLAEETKTSGSGFVSVTATSSCS